MLFRSTCVRMGYDLFDVVIPTREARHRKLYVWNDDPATVDVDGDFYHSVTMKNLSMQHDKGPIDKHCDCSTCQSYSAGYVHAMFRANLPVGERLASIHNLRFYARLMERLQELTHS